MLAVELDDSQLDMFEQYCALLQDWNNHINLTSITGRDAIYELHFLDSLTVARVCDVGKVSSVIDVGTGAGFPGLALAIAYPVLRVTLLESIDKKARFLSHVSDALGLQDRVQVICNRAETLAMSRDHRGFYELAVARAVARLNVLSEYCLPLVKPGGIFVAQKGPLAEQELDEAKVAIRLLGGGHADIHRISLPGGSCRSLVSVRKVAATPDTYPRRVGLPSKKPIV